MNLSDYFMCGTGETKSGGRVGIEIETQFSTLDYCPISTDVTDQLLKINVRGHRPKLELGRQNIELSIRPQPSFQDLDHIAWLSTDMFYYEAQGFGAYPCFGPTPFIDYPEPLLYVQEERDTTWVELDGAVALENLCRCSSIQFSVDVNPDDAINWINLLWDAKLHEVDYAGNDMLWKRYIEESYFGYRPDRYGGPAGFEDIGDYVARLGDHAAVMPGDENMFLRSVWWHYRLRRYCNSLVLEIRPMARRSDDFRNNWKRITDILGL